VLIEHVVRAHDGHLQDDATVMCLDWYGTDSTRRDANHGADLAEASPTAGQRTEPPEPVDH
ncbi:serine/threonine-protein phosphatase, partial [Streptomyces sp. NPDC060054]